MGFPKLRYAQKFCERDLTDLRAWIFGKVIIVNVLIGT